MNMKNRDVWRQHYFFLLFFFSCWFFLAVVLNCALKSPCAITPMCGQCKRNRRSVNWNIRSDLFCISWILFPLVHNGDHFMLQSAVNLSLHFVAVTSQQRLSCFFFFLSFLYYHLRFSAYYLGCLNLQRFTTAYIAWPASQKCCQPPLLSLMGGFAAHF